jgi:glycosyltransferase involved in cell wall biosynthesis
MPDQGAAEFGASTVRGARRVAAAPLDAARWAARMLPDSTRSRLRNLADDCDGLRAAAPIESWSVPFMPGPRSTSAVVDVLTGAMTSAGGPGVVAPVLSPGPTPTPARPDEAPAVRCLVVTGLLDVGGMDEVVAFLARRLPEHGFLTAVLHATDKPSAGDELSGRLGRMLRSSGVEVIEADESGALDWIRRWRPDVITAHGVPDWMVDIAQQVGVPYVDNLHGMHTHFAADWTAEAARTAKVSAIVSVSDLMRSQYLAGNPRFPADRIVTIPNGVDDERRRSGDREAIRARLGLADEYVFVSLARHCQQKNSYGLLTAFAELARRRSDVHLVIAGKPSQSRYYRRTLRLRDELPCGDRVHLRDHAAAPAALLAAADGFVLDSFFEGWSLASMEALFAGLPVVLSDVGGAREQIGGDADRGYLVANPLGDPLAVTWESLAAARFRPQVNQDELVAAMDYLVTDRERYLHNREHLAAESAGRFSAAACLRQHAAVLNAVAAGADLAWAGGLTR